MKAHLWLPFTLITLLFWGVWGALIEIPEQAGFPATLGYSVWALTMIPPALVAGINVRWRLDFTRRSVVHGLIIGLLGAGGQLVLFQALRMGPAYIVFPIISVSPLVTILLSATLLKEKATGRGWIGIALALVAILLLSYQEPDSGNVHGYLWLVLALGVFLAWGLQAFYLKVANNHMNAESIFFYMMLTGLALIPVALLMTDFSQPINWGIKGPYLMAAIQMLNSVGALCLVYAFRYGRAIIVSPLINAGAPVITILLSLISYAVVPHPVVASGIVLAVVAAFLMAIDPEIEEIPANVIRTTAKNGDEGAHTSISRP